VSGQPGKERVSLLADGSLAEQCAAAGKEAQVMVTMRRGESMHIDALRSQDLQKQHRQLAAERHKTEIVSVTMFFCVFLSAAKSSQYLEAQCYSDATGIFIEIFIEIYNFHWHCSVLPPATVVDLLNIIIYCELDRLSDSLSVYNVETVGEGYRVVPGTPESIANHADVTAHFGPAAQQSLCACIFKSIAPYGAEHYNTIMPRMAQLMVPSMYSETNAMGSIWQFVYEII
jgi:hypothetical protein